MIVPKKIFFTKGVGVAKDRLVSFEYALRDAGIQMCNLVYVSSIFPPHCERLTKEEGIRQLHAGEITFCVMARNETQEKSRLVNASIGLALPKDLNQYGYLSEHHSYGQSAKESGEYAEDLAAQLLASTLGIELNMDKSWDERQKLYMQDRLIIETTNVSQAAEGVKDMWTTVIAAAVFIGSMEK